MYRVGVETHTRDDVSAAVAAHRDLGRDYDDAVAEGLVERIGAEIDKRVDARISQGAQPRQVARPATGRAAWSQLAMALGSMGLGVGATGVVVAARGSEVGIGIPHQVTHNQVSGSQLAVVALIWIAIAVINVAYSRRR
jgi:hypothetical protein